MTTIYVHGHEATYAGQGVRISELLNSRFGTVVTEFDTTVRRRQIACPLAEEQLGRSARLRLSAKSGLSGRSMNST